jgi:alcohol dehydrogenase class IV
MNFEFNAPTRILFGEGVVAQLGQIAKTFGQTALFVHGVSEDLARGALDSLAAHEITPHTMRVRSEPSTQMVVQGAGLARSQGCELVIAYGGGSAIDTAKSIASLLTNPGELTDYLEVVGRGSPIQMRSAPFIAVPTTAGTGAEVTRNAVLYVPEHRVKVSMRSALMLAHLALIDPELTYTASPNLTARTGLDALTQVIEPFVSNAANPLTDTVCKEGILRAGRSLLRAYQDGSNRAARLDMAVASFFGGLALANARLGAVHGFAGVLGGMFSGPHGAVCACLLPHVMAINARAIQQRMPGDAIIERFRVVAQLLTGNHKADIQDGVRFIQELTSALNIPRLSTYGINKADFPTIIEKSAASSSMKGNPVKLSYEEMEEILILAL